MHLIGSCPFLLLLRTFKLARHYSKPPPFFGEAVHNAWAGGRVSGENNVALALAGKPRRLIRRVGPIGRMGPIGPIGPILCIQKSPAL